MPIMSEREFLRMSKWYTWPAVEEAYAMHHAHITQNMPEPISIAIDGQYDSPGFSGILEVSLTIVAV